MQLFVSDTGLIYVYPMKSKSEIPDAVKAFAKENTNVTDPWSRGDTKVRKVAKDGSGDGMFVEVH